MGIKIQMRLQYGIDPNMYTLQEGDAREDLQYIFLPPSINHLFYLLLIANLEVLQQKKEVIQLNRIVSRGVITTDLRLHLKRSLVKNSRFLENISSITGLMMISGMNYEVRYILLKYNKQKMFLQNIQNYIQFEIAFK